MAAVETIAKRLAFHGQSGLGVAMNISLVSLLFSFQGRIKLPSPHRRGKPIRPRSADGLTMMQKKARRARRALYIQRDWIGLNFVARVAGQFCFFLPCRIELDRLCHELVAEGFQAINQHAAFARKPVALVCRVNQVFLSLQHDHSVMDLTGICIEIYSNSRLFSAWGYAQKCPA
ncbi:MAG TPA: hypothetical protein VKD19_03005 [Pseudolabrys sp.]|nr:hypothetical protein [Pseudolabrys sp.]